VRRETKLMILLSDNSSVLCAAWVMGDGPPRSVCRRRLQTAQVLLWFKRPW